MNSGLGASNFYFLLLRMYGRWWLKIVLYPKFSVHPNDFTELQYFTQTVNKSIKINTNHSGTTNYKYWIHFRAFVCRLNIFLILICIYTQINILINNALWTNCHGPIFREVCFCRVKIGPWQLVQETFCMRTFFCFFFWLNNKLNTYTVHIYNIWCTRVVEMTIFFAARCL